MAKALEELSAGVSEVATMVSQSVVGVGAGGSGVIVGSGLVATNAHNLRGEEVIVTFPDGRRETAQVAGADHEGDLALLRVETSGAPAVEWAGRPARLGEAVVAVSLPGGRGTRAGLGFVSGADVAFRGPGGRRITGAVEHSAPLPRGSSGGALVDAEGKLLGINTHREGEGFYLALPADEQLRSRIDALSRGEVPLRPRLGVALAPPRVARRLRRSVGLPERDGLLVHAVEQGAPAERAGIRQGDLIVTAAGRPVSSADVLAEVLESESVKGSVELVVVRGVDEVTVAVDLSGGGTAEQATA